MKQMRDLIRSLQFREFTESKDFKLSNFSEQTNEQNIFCYYYFILGVM